MSNLIQCSHSLGQQIVADSRLPLGDYNRGQVGMQCIAFQPVAVFPHDPKASHAHSCLESRGLLWNESFIQGLSPLAFFVHAIFGFMHCEYTCSTTQNRLTQHKTKAPLRDVKLWWKAPPALPSPGPVPHMERSMWLSGYSMRLGVKALESTVTEYDYTVRDGSHIIQFMYNGTGLDPKYRTHLSF